MPTPEEQIDAFFESLDEEHDHSTESSGAEQIEPTDDDSGSLGGSSGGSGSGSGVDDDDEERVFWAGFGPHELWEKAAEDESEAQEALDKAARLRAADAAAASLTGTVGAAVERCPQKDPRHAIEVELFDDEGPVAGGLVELRRKGQEGLIAKRSSGQGEVRFEGLSDGDEHQLRVLGQGSWSVEQTAALPDERKTSTYDAVWGSSPAEEAKGEHVLEQGECLWTLSTRLGLDADTLWEANPQLHEQERTANILAPGDVVKLDEGEPKLEAVSVGQRVRIRCERVQARAKLRFQDDAGKGRSGLSYIIRVTTGDGREQISSDVTDGDGGFDQAVPADATTMEVTLLTDSDPEHYAFQFAYLDPVETIAGVQGRLLNLGFWCGTERGEVGPLTQRALREFQKKYGLSESGEIDSATRSKITELHGS